MGRIRPVIIVFGLLIFSSPVAAQWHGAHYDADTSDYPKIRKDIEMINRLIRLSPDEAKHYVERSVKFRELKDWPYALADIEKADSLRPNQPAIYYEKALIYYGLEDYKKALVFLDSVTHLRPNFEWGWLDRATVYQHLGRHEEALADLGKAMTLKPKWWLPDVIQGQVFEALELKKDAMRSYNAAIVKDKLQPLAFVRRGLLRHKNGDLEKAETDFLEAMRLKPNYPLAAVSLADLWNEKEQYKDALFMANLAVSMDRNYMDAYRARLTAYKGQNRMEEACNDYIILFENTGYKSDTDLKKCLKAHRKKKKSKP